MRTGNANGHGVVRWTETGWYIVHSSGGRERGYQIGGHVKRHAEEPEADRPLVFGLLGIGDFLPRLDSLDFEA